MHQFLESTLLLFVLLNPFLLSIYLSHLVQELDQATFGRVVARAALISLAVFGVVAWLGDLLFTDILQVRFAAFQIFGGLIFVIVGVRFVFGGPGALETLRGTPEHLSGSVAMPFMVGPATISASILAGNQLPIGLAVLGIFAALATTTVLLTLFKWLHDVLRQRRESLVERYWDVTGRVMALIVGTIAVEMLLQGIDAWLGRS